MEAAAAARSSSLATQQVLLLLLSSLATLGWARPTALIVFGDSTVDTGNNNAWPTMAKSNFPPYGRDFPGGRATGRFCNGRMSVDFYSEALGLGRSFVPAYLDPNYGIQDFAIGVNFASAGSGLDVATSGVFNVIPLWKQVDMFREYKSRLAEHLGAAKADEVISGAVYAVSIGTNDYLENYFSLRSARPLQYTVPAYTTYLVGLARSFLSDIHALGARKVGFAGMSPMGCLPVERSRLVGLGCDEIHNAVARSFNAALKDMVAQLPAQLPGADVRVAELYDLVADVLREPARYGFARADVGCCGSGTYEMGYACTPWDPRTCPDASKYFFWDAVHTSESANKLVADFLMNTTFGAFA